MVQPAAELLDEAMEQSGVKKVMVGNDGRGRVDMFIYCEQKDKVYQMKVEEIRPRLKGNFYGYDIIGVGDEVCASDDLIDRIMKYGFDLTRGGEIPERLAKAVKKAGDENKISVVKIGTLERTTGPHDMFYTGMHSNPEVVTKLRQTLPKRIDGALSAELDSIMFKRNLGTNSYIW